MKKVIDITGMTCAHCSSRVEKALNGLDGVEAKVNLKKNQATVTLADNITDDMLNAAISEAGYKATQISEKKSLFGN